MPRKTDPLKVSQESSNTEEGRTTLAFTISAPDTDWRLPDILASQHIIPNLEQMIHEAVQRYFDSASAAIDKLRDNRSPAPTVKKESKGENPCPQGARSITS